MKSKLRKPILLVTEIVIIIVLLFLFSKAIDIEEFKKTLSIFKLRNIAIILLFQFSVQLMGSYQWNIILKQAGAKESFLKILKARIGGYSVSYLTPSLYLGGEPIRAGMIKNANLSYNKIFATVTIDKYVELFSKFPAIVTGLSFMIFFFNPRPVLILISIVIMATLFGFFFFLLIKILYDQSFIKNFFRTVLKGFIRINPRGVVKIFTAIKDFEKEINQIISDKKYFYMAMAIGFLVSLIEVLQTFYILFLMNYQPYFNNGKAIIDAFIIFGSSIFMAIFTIIPANLGGMEGINLFIFTLLGLGPAKALTYTIILRIGQLSFVAVGLIVLFLNRISRKRKGIIK